MYILIQGLQGAQLADLFVNWSIASNPWKALVTIALQIFAFLFLGLIPFIDNFTNIGGVILGFLTALIVVPRLNTRSNWIVILIVRVLAFALIVLYFIVLLAWFFSVGGIATCQVCYYLNPTWDMLFGTTE